MVTKRRSKSIRTEFTAHPMLVDLEDGVQYITKAKIQLENKDWRSKSMQRQEKLLQESVSQRCRVSTADIGHCPHSRFWYFLTFWINESVHGTNALRLRFTF